MTDPGRRARSRPVVVIAVMVAAFVLASTLAGSSARAADGPNESTTTTTAPTPTSTTTTTVAPTTTTTTIDPGSSGDEDPGPTPVAPPVTLAPPDVDLLRSLTSDYEVAGDEEMVVFEQYLAVAKHALELDDQVQDLNARVAAAQAAQAQAEREVIEADERTRGLADQEARAADDLTREQARLRQQTIQAYMGGELQRVDAPVDAVARSGSMNELGTTLVYAGAVVADRRQVIQRVVDLQARLQELGAEADASQTESQRHRDELQAARDAAKRQRDEATALQQAVADQTTQNQALLQAVADKRAGYSERIAALARVSDSISIVLADRQQGQTLPTLTAGIFLSPIPDPKFNSRFGPRVDPVFGTAAMHNGVDMNGQMGTPIRASADGTVVMAGAQGGYGNCTVIDHGSGLGTLYGHQSSIAVTVGQTVKRGDVIGYVGSTGKSTGPHLHWEVRRFGQPTDPVPFIGPG